MLGHMSHRQSETESATSFAGGGIGVHVLRRVSASGRDAVQASNNGMEPTIKSVTPLAKRRARVAPLFTCRLSPTLDARSPFSHVSIRSGGHRVLEQHSVH